MVTELHPSLAQLTAFDQGELAADQWPDVEAHVAGCTTCCAQLETVSDGPLVERLRTAVRAALSGASPSGPGAAAWSGAPAASHGPDEFEVPPALRQHRRYRILEGLGTGGMGTVFRAEHELMARQVALKVLSPRLTRRAELVERFRQEVKAAARLSHPNIVTAFDAEQAGDLHFLVMEFVPGQRVDALLENGPLPIATACDIARQVALGLAHAFERGMVHRDIKPQNLMRLPDGRVKILDFGLARFASENVPVEALTHSGAVLGTPDYIAPEQARDARSADIRADLYSLGCTLYHLLTGQPPFPGGSILQKLLAHENQPPRPVRALRADVPAALERLVMRLLEKKPASRYSTPAEVADLLAPWAEGRVPSEEPGHAASSNSRVWASIIAGAVVFLGGGMLLVAGSLGYFSSVPASDVPVEAAVPTRAEPEATPLVGHREAIIRLAVAADGRRAASVGAEPDVFLWDLAAGKLERRLAGHTDQIRAVAFSHEGDRLLTASADGRVGLWNVNQGENLKYFAGHEGVVQCVAFAPSGSGGASGGYDKTIKVWSFTEEAPVKTLKGHSAPVTGLAYLPAGDRLVSTAHDGALIVWDLTTGQPRQTHVHEHGLMGLALSQSGRFALTACYDHHAYLWDLEKETLVQRFEGHTEPVLDVSLSPDSRYVLSASKDGTVRLWEAATGIEVDVFHGHRGEALAVAFDGPGRRALSGDAQGHLLSWALPIPNPPTAARLEP